MRNRTGVPNNPLLECIYIHPWAYLIFEAGVLLACHSHTLRRGERPPQTAHFYSLWGVRFRATDPRWGQHDKGITNMSQNQESSTTFTYTQTIISQQSLVWKSMIQMKRPIHTSAIIFITCFHSCFFFFWSSVLWIAFSCEHLRKINLRQFSRNDTPSPRVVKL